MTPVWRDVSKRLKSGDATTPDLDARLLVQHASGCERDRSLTLVRSDLTEEAHALLDALVARRMTGEPVSRIVGKRGFWNHDFHISQATLDPRPDSETLIELTLKIVDHEDWRLKPLSILDLGTGSGCLLLSLLDELGHATGVGVDLSADALDVATRNADVVGCPDRVTFQKGDWFDGVTGPFDIVISNPPYIPRADLDKLMPDVRAFDPPASLDGGDDGLDAYRAIVGNAAAVVPDGWLVFECGQGQSDDVLALMDMAGFTTHLPQLRTMADLAGITRCVAGRTQSAFHR